MFIFVFAVVGVVAVVSVVAVVEVFVVAAFMFAIMLKLLLLK